MSRKIAVIGAGVAGLGAACLLQSAGFIVKIFEKSRGLSGRAASRSGKGCRYDHGANYFTTEDEEVRDWIFDRLCSEDLIKIEGEIVPFDRDGNIGASAENRGDQLRYSYRSGISTLGKNMREEFNLDVVQGVQVQGIHSGEAGWVLEGYSGMRPGKYDAVLVTAPLPQTVKLIENSSLTGEIVNELTAALSGIRYFCQYSVVLNFEGCRQLPEDAFAMINSDREHAISWISNENFKQGHVPANESLLVAQMSPRWSAHREGADKADVAQQTFAEVADLLGDDDLSPPQWTDVQWWRFARPEPGAEVNAPPSASAAGLYFAGDGLVGKGRVEGALKSGFVAAREIIGNFEQQ